MWNWILILFMLLAYMFMLLKLVYSGKHVLMSLLSLEGSMMIVMYFLVKYSSSGYISFSGVMMFMVLSVSEGALGLSLLVMMVRGVGKDLYYYVNMF